MLGQIVEELAKEAERALSNYDVDWHLRVYIRPTLLVKLVVFIPDVDGGKGRIVEGGIIHPMHDDLAYAKFTAQKLALQMKAAMKEAM